MEEFPTVVVIVLVLLFIWNYFPKCSCKDEVAKSPPVVSDDSPPAGEAQDEGLNDALTDTRFLRNTSKQKYSASMWNSARSQGNTATSETLTPYRVAHEQSRGKDNTTKMMWYTDRSHV